MSYDADRWCFEKARERGSGLEVDANKKDVGVSLADLAASWL